MSPSNSTPLDGPGKPSRFPKDREVDKAAAELAAKHALPEPPTKNLNWDQMMEYFLLLTPEMWSHISIYLYRLRPRIIRQLKNPNSPNYIDCIGEPFNMDYLIDRHGGGKYMIEATDTGAAKHNSHLFRCNFQIDEVRYRPKLTYEELDINARENMAYIQMLQSEGALDSKGHPMTNPATPAAAASGVNTDLIKEILGFVSKLNAEQQAALRAKIAPEEDGISKSLGQILIQRMQQDDPTKQLQALLNGIKEFSSNSNKQPDINVAQIIQTQNQMASEQRKTDLEYLKLILESRKENTPETNQFAHFREVFGFARDLLDSSGRGRGGGQRNPWDIGLDYARELVVPGLNTLNQFLALRRGVPPTPLTNPAAGPAAFDPYANPAALRQHAASVNAQQPAAGPAVPPTMPPPANGSPLMNTLMQYGNLVVNALNNGTPGFEFADNVASLLGNATHAMIAGQGEEVLVQSMMSIPEIAMFGEPRLKTFTHEFCHYEEFFDQENAETQSAD